MLLMMNMTVLKIAEMMLRVVVASITMLTMKMTVTMVASSPDNDARECGVFGGDSGDDDDDGDEGMSMLINCWWAIDRRVLHALKLLLSSATARSLQRTTTQKFTSSLTFHVDILRSFHQPMRIFVWNLDRVKASRIITTLFMNVDRSNPSDGFAPMSSRNRPERNGMC